MGNSAYRFRLRHLLVAISAVVILTGGFLWFVEPVATHHSEAVRSAYAHGKITREEARESVGETVDQWPEPTPKK
jgi:hypothetical protein